jgi:hypothetical protein
MPYAFERIMPYALEFPANEVWGHKKNPYLEYTISEYMTYMRVNCIWPYWP